MPCCHITAAAAVVVGLFTHFADTVSFVGICCLCVRVFVSAVARISGVVGCGRQNTMLKDIDIISLVRKRSQREMCVLVVTLVVVCLTMHNGKINYY